MKITKVDDDTVQVRFKSSGVSVKVQHYDEYGVLVIGTSSVDVARRALVGVGYELEAFHGGFRPTRVNQEPSRWPWGLWVGGTPAVAFYFEIC